MGTKSPLKSQLKSQENRKCKRVFIVTLSEFDTLPHKDALCKCVTVVDGHTRCLGACYISVTNLLSIHSQKVISNHQSGQRVSPSHDFDGVSSLIPLDISWLPRVSNNEAYGNLRNETKIGNLRNNETKSFNLQ